MGGCQQHFFIFFSRPALPKLGLFFCITVRGPWFVVHSIKGVKVILGVLKMGLFVIFCADRIHWNWFRRDSRINNRDL